MRDRSIAVADTARAVRMTKNTLRLCDESLTSIDFDLGRSRRAIEATRELLNDLAYLTFVKRVMKP